MSRVKSKSRVLGLRTSHLAGDGEIRSWGAFTWPRRGLVAAPDWDPYPSCGGGLHFLLSGAGSSVLLSWAPHAVFQVVEAVKREIVAIDDGAKYKAPRVWVVHTGSQLSATDYLMTHGCDPATIVGARQIGGDAVTLVGADHSEIVAGNHANITVDAWSAVQAGYWSAITAQFCACVVAGHHTEVTAGDDARVVVQAHSIVAVGSGSRVTASAFAVVRGLNRTTLVADTNSILEAADDSVVMGGPNSLLSAGARSVLVWTGSAPPYVCRTDPEGAQSNRYYRYDGQRIIPVPVREVEQMKAVWQERFDADDHAERRLALIKTSAKES